VAIAETGNQAILLLRDIKFDLIFLDMFLPDMHGLTLLSYINQDRRLKHKPKIIAVTAAATTEQISTYEQAGIMQVIKKPIMQEELKHAIDRIHLTDSIQTLRSQIVGDSLCAKSLFNIKTLTFLKENLSTKDFMQLVVEAPEIIDKYINNCKFEIENNNYAETVKVLHTLAGFSAQIGLEQLCQMARDLQTSKKANSQQDIKRLLKLAKSSLVVFKKESL
jgi:CheY-like chemotaxis protein